LEVRIVDGVPDMVRARVFCRVKEVILVWVEQQVSNVWFRNQSHAIEIASIKLLEADEKRQQDK
jgi:hypothetical protein